ncbi:MAG: FtsQ-type POTRA domain-containing protein [Aquificae bacterium]|nr:FtsQ-type POTRA domain-containing protein [Aquificota bacterium]
MVKKKRKPKKVIKLRFILVSIWLIICASLGLFLPQIPIINELIKIDKIEIEGYTKINQKEIKKIFEKESWVFLNTNKIEKKIKEKYPILENVNIKVIKPKVIKIKLQKRTPLALIKFRKEKFVLDNKFEIIGLKYFNQEDLENIKYKIIYNDSMMDKKTIKNIQKISESFNDLNIKKYIINISQIACILEDGKTLVFSKENLNKSIKRAKSFFRKVDISKYKYIDFSFDSIVVARR